MTAEDLYKRLDELRKTHDLKKIHVVVPGMYDLKNMWVTARITDVVNTAKSGSARIRCDFDGDVLERTVWDHIGGNTKILKILG